MKKLFILFIEKTNLISALLLVLCMQNCLQLNFIALYNAQGVEINLFFEYFIGFSKENFVKLFFTAKLKN